MELVSDLVTSSCEACRIDAPSVSDDEAYVLLKEIEGWHLIDDGVKKLKKEFNFSSYSDSKDFTNKIRLRATRFKCNRQIFINL